MTKKGFLRDFQGVIGGFLRDFVAIAGFIIFFDYEIAEKSLGYLCTERDFWGVYRGMLGDSRTQKPRAAVAVILPTLQHTHLPPGVVLIIYAGVGPSSSRSIRRKPQAA